MFDQTNNEDDALPKTKRSADWLAYADKKQKKFDEYSKAAAAGGIPPLEDGYSKVLSKHAMDARKMGMDLLKKERDEEGAANMQRLKRQARPVSTGQPQAREEVSARSKTRKKSRSSSR